uniref:tRNA (adenine(58)-N(1))-methyltransferase n=1 Tax=Meloidogyne enterolobii TaxID=390850 RepID=A0A6V7VBC4_MELEN|nr:unnamed protein product [Meloidogyne enterolobii]
MEEKIKKNEETAILVDDCNNKKGSHFLKYNNFVEEGDTVIIYVNPGTKYSIVVKRGKTIHMKYGALRHEFLIGKRYGTPISATAGYVYILRPSPHLWTQTCPKRTQICILQILEQ